MKTAEELNALRNEVETLNKKLTELTEEELAQVSGGDPWPVFTLLGDKGERKGYNVGFFPGLTGFP